MTVKDVYDLVDRFAPFHTQESWDNSGLLLGSPDKTVAGVVTALDVTPYEVEFAVRKGANLIVAHHPVIFHPLKSIDDTSVYALLIRNGIHVIAAHTNLDKAPGGVNDTLCEKLGLAYKKCEETVGEGFLNMVQFQNPLDARDAAAFLGSRLGGTVTFTDGGKPIRNAVLCSGSGGSFVRDAVSLGADALITGEAGYHDHLEAKAAGLSLFAAGHYETENHISGVLARVIGSSFPDLPVYISDRSNAIGTVL